MHTRHDEKVNEGLLRSTVRGTISIWHHNSILVNRGFVALFTGFKPPPQPPPLDKYEYFVQVDILSTCFGPKSTLFSLTSIISILPTCPDPSFVVPHTTLSSI